VKKFLVYVSILLIVNVAATKDKNSLNSKKPSTFMWSVSSPTTTVYLMGSIHVASKKMYPLNPKIEDAFKKSNILGVEVNVQKTDMVLIASLVREYGFLKNGNKLEYLLDKETINIVKDLSKEYGLLFNQVNLMQPWLVALTLDQAYSMKFKYRLKYGIDIHFLNEAQKFKKDIVEMESLESQFSIFSELNYDIQKIFLNGVIDKIINKKNETKILLNFWKKGDVKKLEYLILRDFKKYKGSWPLYQALIVERNIEMTKKIEKFLKSKKKYFIVVGAGHLIGDNGVVRLLRDKGYKIKRY